jgi:hypothetical protein
MDSGVFLDAKYDSLEQRWMMSGIDRHAQPNYKRELLIDMSSTSAVMTCRESVAGIT